MRKRKDVNSSSPSKSSVHSKDGTVKKLIVDSISTSALRFYLQKNVIVYHKNCSICKGKFFSAITRAILMNVSSSDIIAKYSGKNGQPEFGKMQVYYHKKHMGISKMAVLKFIDEKKEPAMKYRSKSAKRDIAITGKTNLKRNDRDLLDVIQMAILEKSNKLGALELLQVAKLKTAKNLEKEITRRATAKEPDSSGTNYYTAIGFGELHDLYLKYLKDIGDLQIKILKFFHDIPNSATVNSSMIATTVQNKEMEVIRYLVDSIKDEELCARVTREVGLLFNKLNGELTVLLKPSSEREVSPVDVAYEELKSSLCMKEEETPEEEDLNEDEDEEDDFDIT